MSDWMELLLILLALTNLLLVAMSRMGTCIRLVAAQGVVLGLLTMAARADMGFWHLMILVVGSVGLKSVVFPWLLSRALQQAQVRREVEPFVGYATSIAIAAGALPVAFWLGTRLPLPNAQLSGLIVPMSFHAIVTGLFLIVSRRKAITQVLGYLVLENGIYAFGVCLVHDAALLVELGVLLDIFVAVFVMGITIFHISREFDHIDVDRLTLLKD